VRAREPDATGDVERGGVRSHYEVHGDGPAILLLPTWSIAHSRIDYRPVETDGAVRAAAAIAELL
jgi:hypothetical protein